MPHSGACAMCEHEAGKGLRRADEQRGDLAGVADGECGGTCARGGHSADTNCDGPRLQQYPAVDETATWVSARDRGEPAGCAGSSSPLRREQRCHRWESSAGPVSVTVCPATQHAVLEAEADGLEALRRARGPSSALIPLSQCALEERQHAIPGLLRLIVVVHLGIRWAPAVQGFFV